MTQRDDFRPRALKAVRAVKEQKGISLAPGQVQATNIASTPQSADGDTAPVQDLVLPEWIPLSQIDFRNIQKPPLLVDRLLHREAKMILAGGSKMYKSWALLDLGLSLAAGAKWWNLQCAQAMVLYINFELITAWYNWRVGHIIKAKQIKVTTPDYFHCWHLRHKCYDLSKLSKVIRQRVMAKYGRLDVIIIDPIYKAYGGWDENSASEMALLMNVIEELSYETGAAIAYGAHFSKGAQAQKEAKDRISGSGVFARDPDAILTMTRHRADESYVIETDLRYCKKLEPFVVSWKFPLLSVDEGKDPEDLWVPSIHRKEQASKTELSDEDVLRALVRSGMQDIVWRDQVKSQFGKAGNAYYEAKKRLIEQGRVIKSGLKYMPTAFALEAD